MNERVNKFLLAGDKIMPGIHLIQLGFTYSACGQCTKNKERIQKFKEQKILDIFIKTSYEKLFFNLTWLMKTLKI